MIEVSSTSVYIEFQTMKRKLLEWMEATVIQEAQDQLVRINGLLSRRFDDRSWQTTIRFNTCFRRRSSMKTLQHQSTDKQ